jgi:hypothetical protein
VLIGDLVLLPDKNSVHEAPDDFEAVVEVKNDDAGSENAAANGKEDASETNGSIKSGTKKYQSFENRIVTVTESNLSDFTIYDVIMPVPGWRVRY